MDMQLASYLVHFSNILMLVSYSVRDILWLRWFAVAAALTAIPYYLVQGTVLWPPVLWALVFTVINLYQIARIYLERRPVILSDDEQTLYDLGFRSLRPREFISLLLVGQWKSADGGERVVTEGQPLSSLCIAITGRAEVRKQGHLIGLLRPGQIIGAALAMTGDPATVDVSFTEPARYMQWSLPSLRRFVETRPDLRVTLQALVNRDLAGKLERALSP
jgi:hypothetical protein